jgi:hypothetical protein
MQTFIDGQPLNSSTPVTTLGAALAAVRERSGDRLVIEVEADGVSVPGEHLSQPPSTSPYASVLRFKTADAATLLRDSLMYASTAVRELRPRQIAAAEMIQSSKTSDAMVALTDVLTCWEQAKQVLQLAGTLGVTAPAGLGDTEISGAVGELTRTLEEIKRSLREQDWSSLSDTLAYDMPGLSDRWGTMLGELAVNCRRS